jgi:hypothetical protein
MAAGLLMPVTDAKAVAARIDALGDWNFTDKDAAHQMAPGMRALCEELKGDLVFRQAAASPLFDWKEGCGLGMGRHGL